MNKHENLEDTQLDDRLYRDFFYKYSSKYATKANIDSILLGRLVNELLDKVGKEAQKGNIVLEIFRG